jgi:hypothetical protein
VSADRPARPLPADLSWREVGADGDPDPVVVLDGSVDASQVPALIARLQDFHLRAVRAAPLGLLRVPDGRIYAGNDYPMFATHPDVDGWLLVGPADQLAPGALVRVHRRKGDPIAVRVVDWVASRAVAHRDGHDRLWVMARFERVMP